VPRDLRNLYKIRPIIEAVMDERRALNPTRRFGTPAEFGAVCAFLCSMQAAYLTGQNILLDGGAYPGTY
jgi:3-oxoacyl-[acyl-carrier protein] reductase